MYLFHVEFFGISNFNIGEWDALSLINVLAEVSGTDISTSPLAPASEFLKKGL